jgi:hypothetical protein
VKQHSTTEQTAHIKFLRLQSYSYKKLFNITMLFMQKNNFFRCYFHVISQEYKYGEDALHSVFRFGAYPIRFPRYIPVLLIPHYYCWFSRDVGDKGIHLMLINSCGEPRVRKVWAMSAGKNPKVGFHCD